jgi:hypothetical protein
MTDEGSDTLSENISVKQYREGHGRTILGVRDIPVIDKKVAHFLIIMLAFIASRAEWHCLDQGTATQHIQYPPCRLIGIQGVPGKGLALGHATDCPFTGFGVIVEVEQRDIAEVKVCEIGQYIICQPYALKVHVAGIRRDLRYG